MSDDSNHSMEYDPEGTQNSADSFEKQLQQQERELQEQLKLQETEEVADATNGEAEPKPVAAPTSWQDENNEEMAVEEENDEGLNNVSLKRPSSPAAQENGKDDTEDDKETKQPDPKQRKLDEFAKLWTGVTDNPKDFQAWVLLLQHVDQQSELESGREAYAEFFSRYPYCYGYWKKFADLEKRKGTKESTLKVFDSGLAAIPLSVDLWVHYLDYITTTFQDTDEESFVKEQFERAVNAAGLEYRSDKLWDAYITWEINEQRFARATSVYDRLLATPNSKYLQHWTKFQDHVKAHTPAEVLSPEEYLSLRKSLKADDTAASEEDSAIVDEAPPGVEEDAEADAAAAEAAAAAASAADEEENKSIRELILSVREKIHQATTDEVKLRLPYEDGIKRPYFHIKPLERSQLQLWRDYLEFEVKQGNEKRTRILFERCLIAAALYEEFWMRYLHYLNTLTDVTDEEIRSVYKRACNIHLKDKIKPHLSWASFEEERDNISRALELLVETQERLPEALEPHLQAVAVERRRGNLGQAEELFKSSIETFKNKDKLTPAYTNMIVRYARFLSLFVGENEKAFKFMKTALSENTPETPTDSDQKCMETLLWGVVERAMSCSPPAFGEAAEALTSGTTDKYPPRTRLLFANRYNQFVAECGPPNTSVSEATKLLRELQQEIRQLEATQESKEDCQDGQISGESRREKKSKSVSGDKSHAPSGPQQQNGGGNMPPSGGPNAYGGPGGYHQPPPQQPHYPPNPASGGPPPQHPPSHPPPANQGGYGGYNQNYQQQGYPPQQYQGGWGYPQQQQGGYGGYNQQNWTGYQNYYGQR